MVSVSLSKALDNSIKSPRIYLLYSKDSRIWLTNCTIACLVKCSVWKPNSLEYRILLSVKYRVQTIENYPFENVLKAGKHSYCPVVKGYIRGSCKLQMRGLYCQIYSTFCSHKIINVNAMIKKHTIFSSSAHTITLFWLLVKKMYGSRCRSNDPSIINRKCAENES